MKIQFKDYEDYAAYFIPLIEKERREEMRRQWEEIKTMPAQKRERVGRAILNLRGKPVGRGIGGYHLVRYSRDNFPDTEISVGDVVLISGRVPKRNNPTGVVYEKGRNFITVAFSSLPPKFAMGRAVRVDLYASDVTFQRMLSAVKSLEHRQDLQEFLFHSHVILHSRNGVDRYFDSNLNDSQKCAVNDSLTSERVFLVHGPPGTGKTTTLVESIIQHVKRGEKVLATADSNIAVDNILEKLVGKVNVVRIGSPARISRVLWEHTLDYKVEHLPEYRHVSELWEKVEILLRRRDRETKPSPQWSRGLTDDEILYLASQRKSIRGIPAERIQSMALWLKIQNEISELVEKARAMEMRGVRKILESAEVVCATNSSAGSEILEDWVFDTVFIDEATQSTEPSCLISIIHGKRFIMAGDPKQLPPTVISQSADDLKFTLFERLISLHGNGIVDLLNIQYRMNEKLMEFPSRYFYNGAVKTYEKIADIKLNIHCNASGKDSNLLGEIFNPDNVLIFVDTNSLMPEQQRHGATSFFNLGEAELVKRIADGFLRAGVLPEQIGVISPYDDQVSILKSKVEVDGIEIKSVDGFQGREKDLIIISFVRSNPRTIGFLVDKRRLNVSITRARRKLVMIGDAKTLSMVHIYNELINFVKENGKYIRVQKI